MERELKQIIRQKITDALAARMPAHTHRDVHLPGIKGKAMAVIGMRRSGKTTFLWQCLDERLKAGMPRDALLYFNFEDERLAEMTAQELPDARRPLEVSPARTIAHRHIPRRGDDRFR